MVGVLRDWVRNVGCGGFYFVQRVTQAESVAEASKKKADAMELEWAMAKAALAQAECDKAASSVRTLSLNCDVLVQGEALSCFLVLLQADVTVLSTIARLLKSKLLSIKGVTPPVFDSFYQRRYEEL